MKKPLLSICIPTYNRCEPLKIALQSLVSEVVFTESDDVEIVVTDNCSTDMTKDVVLKFVADYPGKIHYHRNEENIGAEPNFQKALSNGRGEHLRLYNDYLFCNKGSLGEILDFVRSVRAEKPLIFLTNGGRPAQPLIELCDSLDELLKSASYFTTWIGGLGIWFDQFWGLEDFLKNKHTKLVQTDVLFRLITKGYRCAVLHKHFFSAIDVGIKSGYNVAEVFGSYFIKYLVHYCNLGFVDHSTVEQVKRETLEQYILGQYFNSSNGLDKSSFFVHMSEYRDDPYFYKALEDFIFQLEATSTHLANQCNLFQAENDRLIFENQKLKASLDDYEKRWAALSECLSNDRLVQLAAGPDFDQEFYLEASPDVAISHFKPVVHFAIYGFYEKRSYKRSSD